MSNTPKISLSVKDLKKNFDRKQIFDNITFELGNSTSLAIAGRNGSGKSTLIKILANLLSPTSGTIELNIDNNLLNRKDYYKHIGFVSPYLNLYDEFTGKENLEIVSKIRGLNNFSIDEVLNQTGLYERRNDLLKIYSSGMKQRLKMAFAFLHNPNVLLLDEPTSNLDKDGIDIVTHIINEYKKDRIVIIATNDEYEKSLCEKEVRLNS